MGRPPPPSSRRPSDPRRPDAFPGREGVAFALVGFALGLVAAQIAGGIAAWADHYRLGSAGPIPLAVEIPDLVGLWACLVASVVAYSRLRGGRRLSVDFGARVARWWEIPLGAAVGLASQYGLVPLLYLPFERIDRHLSHQLGQPAARDAGSAHSNLAAVLVLVFLGIGSPLVEELFFRGLLLRSLAGWAGPRAAVVISGVLFALAHFEALQLAGLAAFGVVLGVLAWRTGRLAASVSAHMAFNVAAVLSVVHFR